MRRISSRFSFRISSTPISNYLWIFPKSLSKRCLNTISCQHSLAKVNSITTDEAVKKIDCDDAFREVRGELCSVRGSVRGMGRLGKDLRGERLNFCTMPPGVFIKAGLSARFV